MNELLKILSKQKPEVGKIININICEDKYDTYIVNLYIKEKDYITRKTGFCINKKDLLFNILDVTYWIHEQLNKRLKEDG